MIHSRYHPELYDLSRPIYPMELFAPLRVVMGRRLPEHLSVLDLACGTGLVWNSVHPMIEALDLEFIQVDPNRALLEAATAKLAAAPSSAKTFTTSAYVASAEQLPIGSASVDVVLVGSAWHWFKVAALSEIERVLKPGGAIFVFEYQFPKLESDTLGLNEWIRRQFNETWKFEDQVPRGNLYEKTQSLRDHSEFSQIASRHLEKSLEHSADFFSEMIFSQARFLDFETRNEKQKVLDVRNETREHVKTRFGTRKEAAFAYRFEGFLFQKRQV
ncbi:MAG: class I SAM-dependent methyltransferase [Bdellovibrionales bacterium]|nr:class I SAM-dependent methyltransferase [Bdellovibrionales bacterium]